MRQLLNAKKKICWGILATVSQVLLALASFRFRDNNHRKSQQGKLRCNNKLVLKKQTISSVAHPVRSLLRSWEIVMDAQQVQFENTAAIKILKSCCCSEVT